MKQSQPSPAISNVYWPIFRKHAHLLLAWGHEAIKRELIVTNEDDEESITGFLYEAIRKILRSDQTPWLLRYTVHNESPIPGKAKGKNRRKTDLCIEFVGRKERPEYVFEAKPQNYAKSHQRTSYYVGTEGMQRFLEGEYANYTADYPEVGMIAYVLSDSVEIWRDRLKTAIDRQQIQLGMETPQVDVAVIDEFPFEWRSQHRRSNSNASFSIYHVLLDCTPH